MQYDYIRTEFVSYVLESFNAEDEITQKKIVSLFLSYSEDGLSRSERQDKKRRIETKCKNDDGNQYEDIAGYKVHYSPVEELGCFDDIRATKITRVQLKEELRKICKVTSINTQKRLTTQLCDTKLEIL